jgi:glycerol-3-phosphate acyltransferase PlsY
MIIPIPNPIIRSIVFSLTLAGLLGYTLGAVPSAYLLVRWKSHRDIRREGSGNVGALNSYQVTGSMLAGIVVLAADVLKGICAVMFSQWIWGRGNTCVPVAGICAIVGHCFPLSLDFKGGRGLATAAGVFGLFALPLVGAWCVVWCVAYVLLKSVNPANAVALLVSGGCAILAPGWFIAPLTGATLSAGLFRMMVLSGFGVVLVRHVSPIREFLREARSR